MENSKETITHERSLKLVAFFYYLIMFFVFVIGLYGLLSLLWMSSASLEHEARMIGFFH